MGNRQHHHTRPPAATRRRRVRAALVGAAATLALASSTMPPVGAAIDVPPWSDAFGSSGSAQGQLQDPIAVAADSANRWYVADYANDRISVFGPTGTFQKVIGSSGTTDGKLDGPSGLTVLDTSHGERLLVADEFNDRLQVFTLGGIHQATITSIAGATPTTLNAPAGVAQAPDGTIAVADRLRDRVLLLSPALTLVHEVELVGPSGVAFSADGSVLYVANASNDLIKRIRTSNGDVLEPFDLGMQGEPHHIATDPIGFVYAPDVQFGKARKVSPAGVLQWSIGSGGSGQGQMSSPRGIGISPDGHLALAEMGNDRVQVWDLCPGGFTDVPESHPFWWHVCWMDTANVSTGYPDGTYRPTQVVTRQAMAAFLARASDETVPPGPGTPTFSDVPPGHPYYDEIEWMVAKGIASGYADGTFRPGGPVSRQAMARFLQRASGLPEESGGAIPMFTDVPKGSPFYADVQWVVRRGVASGYPDGTYRPTQPVTRQAMSAFLARLALIS